MTGGIRFDSSGVQVEISGIRVAADGPDHRIERAVSRTAVTINGQLTCAVTCQRFDFCPGNNFDPIPAHLVHDCLAQDDIETAQQGIFSKQQGDVTPECV